MLVIDVDPRIVVPVALAVMVLAPTAFLLLTRHFQRRHAERTRPDPRRDRITLVVALAVAAVLVVLGIVVTRLPG